jgi:thiamine kinase-like enzyme
LYCIDFEYCCSSHPLFELAGVIACHRLSPSARQWLIQQYLDNHPHLTSNSVQALGAALDIFWLYSCAWALQMADRHCNDHHEFFSWFDNYRQLIRE